MTEPKNHSGEARQDAGRQALESLTRKPISASNRPTQCYCKPGQCMAPVVMGFQTPCLDPAKRDAKAENSQQVQTPRALALEWFWRYANMDKDGCTLDQFGVYRADSNAYSIAEALTAYAAHACEGRDKEIERLTQECCMLSSLAVQRGARVIELESENEQNRLIIKQQSGICLQYGCEHEVHKTLVARAENAEAALAALRASYDESYEYLSRLFTQLAPQCKPSPDLPSLCTQIDNYIAGTVSKASFPAKAQQAVNEIRPPISAPNYKACAWCGQFWTDTADKPYCDCVERKAAIILRVFGGGQ